MAPASSPRRSVTPRARKIALVEIGVYAGYSMRDLTFGRGAGKGATRGLGTLLVSSLNDWIAELFACPDLLRMGHAQRKDDLNLGLGWLYYALGRILRPSVVVVIGSFRGFAPLVLARALGDNGEGGKVHFMDPSLVDDFWRDDATVQSYFQGFGVTNLVHHRLTTQQFVEMQEYRQLGPAGIVLVDGYHTAAQAKFDFEAFAEKLTPEGVILLHDSIWKQTSPMYGPGREYVRDVVDFVNELKSRPTWQVFDLPFGEGVSLVRRVTAPPLPNAGQWAPS